MKLLSLIFLFLSSAIFSWGQLVTSTGTPVTTLVQNFFQGQGVTISNINFIGANNAIGYFNGSNTNLGIAEGIVITTGTVQNTGNGPHGPNNKPNAGVDNNEPGYGLLTSLVGNDTYNASILSFDFETCSDSISFEYVFGSEEYPEYVGSQFNDVFAFFISGPGFSGNQNIARLPSGQVVSINTVNNGNYSPASGVSVTGPTNPYYYVPNGDGSQAPFNSSNFYIQYDGFTKVLTAKAKVQCNSTYNIKIAIADVGDGIYDSGIFLKANSFNASSPVDAEYQISQNLYNDNSVMAESCVSTTVTMTRSTCNIGVPLTVNLSTSGVAQEGIDYTDVPQTVTFAPGSETTTFQINALADGIDEPRENIIIHYSYIDNCGNLVEDEFELFIEDVNNLELELTGEEVTCPGEEVTIQSSITGGGEPYMYSWSNGADTPTINVSPTVTTTYTLEVTDACLNQTIVENYTVVVPTFEPIAITTSDDITEICPYLPTTLTGTATGGYGSFSYSWTDSEGNQLGNSTSQSVTPSQTTTYFITATDACGLTETSDILYTITSPPLVVDITPEQQICPGDSAFLEATVSGGYGGYYYYWPHSEENTPSVWVHPSVTTNYMVIVSDECQTFSVPAVTTVIVDQPDADFIASSHTLFDELPITFQNLTVNGVTYEWDFGNGNSSDLVHPNNVYDEPGDYVVTLIATDEFGCVDTIQKPITILEAHYIYIPNTFTPDGSEFNETFEAVTIGIDHLDIQIFNRWGELIFSSNDKRFQWDGTYKGVMCQDGVYTYRVEFVANNGTEGEYIGHVNLLR